MDLMNLIVEVTRRCNMYCDHCLRGEPQNKDLKPEVVDKMFYGIKHIDNITFTGGEPTLAVKQIEMVVDKIIERGISINSFYIVTNGKIASFELCTVLLKFWQYIDHFEECIHVGGLCISKDSYHEGDYEKAERLYSAFTFYKPNERNRDYDRRGIIPMGRGKNWGKGKVQNDKSIEIDDDVVDNEVYINVNGDLVLNCDYSYATQARRKIGNVLNDNIETILRRKLENDSDSDSDKENV